VCGATLWRARRIGRRTGRRAGTPITGKYLGKTGRITCGQLEPPEGRPHQKDRSEKIKEQSGQTKHSACGAYDEAARNLVRITCLLDAELYTGGNIFNPFGSAIKREQKKKIVDGKRSGPHCPMPITRIISRGRTKTNWTCLHKGEGFWFHGSSVGAREHGQHQVSPAE